MDHYLILDLAVDIGYELAMSGAETFRVEDTVNRILGSYGVQSEVFAIPNYLIVSLTTQSGEPITKMRRIGYHGNNLDNVERLNGLSRRICNEHPSPDEARNWLEVIHKTSRDHGFRIQLLGDFLGAAGFGILFGCSILDCFFAGLCGIVIGLVDAWMRRLKVNPFFATIAESFFMAAFAYELNIIGWIKSADAVNIGALMILVPGLLFTNAMRDIIYGDINSGVNRIVQVFLVAAAIALGTAAAWNCTVWFHAAPHSVTAVSYPLLIQCAATFLACVGFSILFNIHGPGGLLCALGGAIAWLIYAGLVHLGFSELTGYFWAASASAIYAESMARIRKYPAISYLVVSLFPLLPGAGVYYAMTYAVYGDVEKFASQLTSTAAIAGVLAVGILLVSTSVKMIHTWRTMK